jgi:hypothetical protein
MRLAKMRVFLFAATPYPLSLDPSERDKG